MDCTSYLLALVAIHIGSSMCASRIIEVLNALLRCIRIFRGLFSVGPMKRRAVFRILKGANPPIIFIVDRFDGRIWVYVRY